jgi:hypothetical protein
MKSETEIRAAIHEFFVDNFLMGYAGGARR